MDLARVFSPAAILVPLRARCDDDALRQLVERLVTATGLSDPDRVMQHLTEEAALRACLLYTSPSPRDGLLSRMPSSA